MKRLDVVATIQDCPQRNLMKWQVGTIIEELDVNNVPVEFADIEGVAYAISPIAVAMLLKLKHTPLRPSSTCSTVAKPCGS